LTRLPWRRIALVVLVAVVPLRSNFQFGQQHLVVLALLTLAAWAYFGDRPVLSGVALAAVAMIGGTDYAQGQYNRAVQAQRQPGMLPAQLEASLRAAAALRQLEPEM
jgi:hypothetical protein